MIGCELQDGDILQRGDEVSLDNGFSWKAVPFVGKVVFCGVNGLRYRRPFGPPQIQQQTQFLDHKAAVTPTTLESDRLRAIIAKEDEHVAAIQANNRDRDRSLVVGMELQLLRENFAAKFRDRAFIVGSRVIETDNGKFSVRSAEVVA